MLGAPHQNAPAPSIKGIRATVQLVRMLIGQQSE